MQLSLLPDSHAKHCTRCARDLPTADFASNRSTSDGLQHYCRSCGAAIYRERQAAKGRQVRERVDVPPGQKHCRGCDETKPHAQWNRNKASRDGWSSYCRSCCAARNRIRYFTKTYGLSTEAIRDLFAKQPVCPVCLKRAPVHVDHDHKTGEVRGLLCFPCNAALGQLQDDPTIIRRAAEYVEGTVWQPIKLAPGVYQMPISPPAAPRSPTSSAPTPRISSPADVRRLRPH